MKQKKEVSLKEILDFMNEQFVNEETLTITQACLNFKKKYEAETGDTIGLSTLQKFYADAKKAYPDEIIEPKPTTRSHHFTPRYEINREEFVPFVQSQLDAGSSIAEACRVYSRKAEIPDTVLYGWYNNHVNKKKKATKPAVITTSDNDDLEEVELANPYTPHVPKNYIRRRDENIAATMEESEDFIVTLTKIMSAGEAAGLDIQKIFGALKPLFELASEAAQCKQAAEDNKMLTEKVTTLQRENKILKDSNEAKSRENTEMLRKVNELDSIVKNFLNMPSTQKLLNLGDFTEQLKYSVDSATGYIVSRTN